jgi:hypothetical protein
MGSPQCQIKSKEPNKNKQKQPPNKPNKKQTNNNRPRKRQMAKWHSDPAGTVEWMMSYASSDGLVWRDKPKQTNKTRT